MSANVITIEIRGLEPAALKAAAQIAALFPSTGPALPHPARGEGQSEVLVRIHADVGRPPGDGDYTDTCA
ncbi:MULTISPECIES: hypothetical protein [unclassified Streptomyces]|uniref:hypothetical protein n=1 Tax=unclassified Streptomyces TaxID=2593676 RepID=UPI00343CC6C4